MELKYPKALTDYPTNIIKSGLTTDVRWLNGRMANEFLQSGSKFKDYDFTNQVPCWIQSTDEDKVILAAEIKKTDYQNVINMYTDFDELSSKQAVALHATYLTKPAMKYLINSKHMPFYPELVCKNSEEIVRAFPELSLNYKNSLSLYSLSGEFLAQSKLKPGDKSYLYVIDPNKPEMMYDQTNWRVEKLKKLFGRYH